MSGLGDLSSYGGYNLKGLGTNDRTRAVDFVETLSGVRGHGKEELHAFAQAVLQENASYCKVHCPNLTKVAEGETLDSYEMEKFLKEVEGLGAKRISSGAAENLLKALNFSKPFGTKSTLLRQKGCNRLVKIVGRARQAFSTESTSKFDQVKHNLEHLDRKVEHSRQGYEKLSDGKLYATYDGIPLEEGWKIDYNAKGEVVGFVHPEEGKKGLDEDIPYLI